MLLGTLGALANGASFPIYAIIFSDMLADMLTLTGDALSTAATKWALVFLGFVCRARGRERDGGAISCSD
jgi:hypothetical protein